MANKEKKQNKIGILTIPRANNYGSVLQTFALQKLLNSQNIKNEIVDYISPFLIGRYRIWCIESTSFLRFIKTCISSFLCFPFRFQWKKKFCFFRRTLNFSKKKYYKAEELNKLQYKAIIFGGDQIWNLRITNYDKVFFGTGLPISIKKFCFSASMGFVDRTKTEINFYKENICNFSGIAIRESYDIQFLRNCTQCENIVSVLDPTLLLPMSFWLSVSRKKNYIEKYILVYRLGNDERTNIFAKRIAKTKGLKVYTISNSWHKYDENGFINIRGVGPREFLSLIRDAEMIITNSFHGTAFSIVFNKLFYVIPYEGTEGRVLDLTKKLKLEERVILSTEQKLDNEMIDYERVNELLLKHRVTGEAFIATIKDCL